MVEKKVGGGPCIRTSGLYAKRKNLALQISRPRNLRVRTLFRGLNYAMHIHGNKNLEIEHGGAIPDCKKISRSAVDRIARGGKKSELIILANMLHTLPGKLFRRTSDQKSNLSWEKYKN